MLALVTCRGVKQGGGRGSAGQADLAGRELWVNMAIGGWAGAVDQQAQHASRPAPKAKP